mmetsp:Transcript_1793/g.1716  ORF Transcript_1793/g.1716 Transcript_1793/m.1716 type:complete len:80 (+) Transcript_1793:435-674(+)
MGSIIFSTSVTIFGLTFAFIRGWSYSFIVLCAFPFLAVSGTVMMSMAQKSFSSQVKAYGQSGGYAEQALNSIKVVVSFG